MYFDVSMFIFDDGLSKNFIKFIIYGNIKIIKKPQFCKINGKLLLYSVFSILMRK